MEKIKSPKKCIFYLLLLIKSQKFLASLALGFCPRKMKKKNENSDFRAQKFLAELGFLGFLEKMENFSGSTNSFSMDYSNYLIAT